MSHTTGDPHFLDNGAGHCWHCDKPKVEHPGERPSPFVEATTGAYEANFASKVYTTLEAMPAWSKRFDLKPQGLLDLAAGDPSTIPWHSEVRELATHRDRILVETLEPQLVPKLGERRVVYAWIALNKVKFLRFEKEKK